jgi:hypothetical protein
MANAENLNGTTICRGRGKPESLRVKEAVAGPA